MVQKVRKMSRFPHTDRGAGTSPRVLLCGRPDLLSKPGGDTRQILTLQRELGPRAELSLELQPDCDRFEVVHVFNLSRPVEPALQAACARAAGVPVVCTPIYQDLWRYNRRGRVGSGRALFEALGRDDARLEDLRALLNLWRAGPWQLVRRPGLCLQLLGHALGAGPTPRGAGPARGSLELQRRLLENSRVVVFNSALEERSVARNLGVSPHSMHGEVVPVGIDPAELEAADPAPFARRFGLEGFVLCVGRFEDLKNQLNLVRALAPLPLPLVLVGGANPRHPGYNRALRRAVARRPQTLLLSGLPRALVLSAMAAAAVHVLPSWFETAGLTSLEAALAGCAVVSTEVGYASAYLQDQASYCDPGDQASIRRAVQTALERGPSARLRRRIRQRFTVRASAQAMQRIYHEVAG